MTKKKEAKEPPKKTKDQQIEELKDTLARVQADTDNYRKRIEKESEEFKKYAASHTIGNILPILDSFQLALENTNDPEQFKKGMDLIYSQLYDTLEKEGLRKIETKNQPFDPYKHEVLLSEKTTDEKNDNLIAQELQKGFMFKDKVLRYAKVKVYKKEGDDNHAGEKN